MPRGPKPDSHYTITIEVHAGPPTSRGALDYVTWLLMRALTKLPVPITASVTTEFGGTVPLITARVHVPWVVEFPGYQLLWTVAAAIPAEFSTQLRTVEVDHEWPDPVVTT